MASVKRRNLVYHSLLRNFVVGQIFEDLLQHTCWQIQQVHFVVVSGRTRFSNSPALDNL